MPKGILRIKKIIELKPLHYILFSIIFLLSSFIGYLSYDINFSKLLEGDVVNQEVKGVTAPNVLSFQGRMTDRSDTPITSPVSVTFNIYSVPTGGTALWTGTCSITPDQDGIFETLLGGTCGTSIPTTIFSENIDTYLGITVGSDSEMIPRQKIVSSAYALNADTLDGFDSSQTPGIGNVVVLDTSGNLTFGVTNPVISSSGDIILSPTDGVGINTTDPLAKLDVLNSTGDSFRAGNGTNYFFVNQNGTAISVIPANQSYFSAYSVQASADTYSRLGLGLDTGSPYIALGPGNTDKDIFLKRDLGDFTISFGTTPSEKFRFTSAGYLGIGTPTPSVALDVVGDIKASGTIRNVTVSGTVAETAATVAKTTTISNYTLTTGDLLSITFTSGNTAAAATLNVNGTGAKNIRLGNTNVTAVNMTLAAGSTILMYYDGTYFQIMGSQRLTDTATNTYDRTYWNNAITAGVAIYDYKIVMQASNGKWYPLTLEEGTGTTKTVSTQPFNINSPILYYATTTNVAANGTFANVYSEIPTTNLHYTANTTTQTSQLPVYLKGTIDTNGNFVLDNSTYTSFLTQTLPTSEDGYVYILLGQMYSTTGLRLFQYHPMYEYKDGRVRPYGQGSTTFTGLIDTPSAYTSSGGYLVRVNAGATGLEFVEPGLFTDTNDYVDSVSFNSSDGVLTLGRTGALADLTADLDGRYALLSAGMPSGTEGQMLYNNAGTWTAYSGMYWNDTYNRLGINTTSPSVALDVAGQARFVSTTFPVVDIYRETNGSAGSIYGGAKLERLMSGGTATNGTGIGFYFKAPDNTGVSTFAGMFGGALYDVTNGSEKGEIVFGASWAGADPYATRHLVIQATGASSSRVLIPNGTLGVNTTSTSYTLDVNGSARISTLSAGTTDSVVINSSGVLQSRTIDSRVWGSSSLVDGSGTANQLAYWSDSNTLGSLDYSSWDTNSSDDITSFLGLTDTPSAYTGLGTYLVRVNSGATALEFVEASTFTDTDDQRWNEILDPNANKTFTMGSYITDFTFNSLTSNTGFGLSSSSVTSGKILGISSTSTGLTGSLADITLSGSNAANTGSLLSLNNTGTLNTNTTFLLNHYATGTGNLAFRVNDVSGDTSPFVIDGAGNVGIGVSNPSSNLQVLGTFSAGLQSANRYVSVGTYGVLTSRYDDNAIKNTLTLENRSSGYGDEGVSQLFNLSASGGVAKSGAQFIVAKEQVWTTTASTQDSYFALRTTLDGVSAEKIRLQSSGNLGIGVSSPTGVLHLKAGTASANSAPLKFTTGVNLTTAESGAMEWDGSRLYMTNTTPTRNTMAYLTDIPAGATYWTRSGSTLYPTTSGDNVIPNGTANLGSDTARWADLFLSSSTLHLGSSTTDEGIISYDTTNNIFKFDTDSTTNGDISFFTDDLYLDKSSGNIGIGTTSPSSSLQINAPNGVTGLTINGGTYGDTDLFKMVGNANTQRLILERSGGATTFLEAGGSIGLFGTTTNHDFRIRTNYTDRMSITTAGYVGIGDISPTSLLTVGNGDLFQVNSSGDLIKIKNVTYSWPGSNASGVLTNNGSGTLTWTPGTVDTDDQRWDEIVNPSANKTFTMGSYNTDFQYNTFTSGSAFKLSSSSTGFTGSLLDLSLTGSNASNIGNLLTLYNTGTLNANTSLLINHYATGTNNIAFRVNDVSGDTTPFVVDGDGKVGIGTESPSEKVHITDGTLLIDSPMNPTLKGTYDTSGSARSVYVSDKFAYVSDGTAGLQIVDISNAQSPSLTGTYDTPGTAGSVYVSGKYAYIADSTSGVQIVDISNPNSPSLTGTYSASEATGVYVSGKYAYVTDVSDGLLIIDISNPSIPTLAGSYDFTGSFAYASGLYVSGKYAYVAVYMIGMSIVDISNPSSPSLAGSIDTGAAWDIYVSGKYAYVADGTSGLQIVNITNPASPTIVGTYNTSGDCDEVYVSGKYAYVADRAGGLVIVDVSNPSSPTLVGTYDTPGSAYGVQIAGKYAYVADDASGLHIIDILGADIHAANIGNISSNNSTIWENMDIGNNLYVRNGVNIGSGGLYVGGGAVSFDSNLSATAFSIKQSGVGDIFNVFDNNTKVFTILDGGGIRIDSFGAGTVISDASGNLSVSSDENLKDIKGDFTKGLNEILQLNPILYNWNELSQMDMINTYAGFSAQNVQLAIPEAVGVDINGFLSLSDRPILAATVNAIKEQQGMISTLTSNISTLNGTQINNKNITEENIRFNTETTTLEYSNDGISWFEFANNQSLILLSSRVDDIETRISTLEQISSRTDSNTLNILKVKLNSEGNIELLGGNILMEGDGTLSIKKLKLEENYSIGSSKILANTTSIVIETKAITTDSKVFINPTSDTLNKVLYVTELKVGESFKVNINGVLAQDITFDWFIIDSKKPLETIPEIIQPIVEPTPIITEPIIEPKPLVEPTPEPPVETEVPIVPEEIPTEETVTP